MKFIITLSLVLLSFVASLKVKKSNSLEKENQGYYYMGQYFWCDYCLYNPYYYMFYYDPLYVPSSTLVYYPYAFRKSEQKQEKKELTLEDAEKEIKQLKKMLYNDENYDVEKIKKEKSYETDWLVKQLKITRALEIEDILKMMETNKNNNAKRESTKKREENKEQVDVKKAETANKVETPVPKPVTSDDAKNKKREENKEQVEAKKVETPVPKPVTSDDAKNKKREETKEQVVSKDEAKVTKPVTDNKIQAPVVEKKEATTQTATNNQAKPVENNAKIEVKKKF